MHRMKEECRVSVFGNKSGAEGNILGGGTCHDVMDQDDDVSDNNLDADNANITGVAID